MDRSAVIGRSARLSPNDHPLRVARSLRAKLLGDAEKVHLDLRKTWSCAGEVDQVSWSGCPKSGSPDGGSVLVCGCSLRTQQGA